MKVFIDSGNVEQIAMYRRIGLINGVTTNPEILAMDGVSSNPVDTLLGIIEAMGDGYVFAQVVSRDPTTQLEEAQRLADLGPNKVIKVIMDLVGLQSIPLIVDAKIPVSATAVNTVTRASLQPSAALTTSSHITAGSSVSAGDISP